jgi:hypothetical protein
MLRAAGFAELLDLADQHVRIAHPELMGTLSPLELARPQRRHRGDPAGPLSGSSPAAM